MPPIPTGCHVDVISNATNTAIYHNVLLVYNDNQSIVKIRVLQSNHTYTEHTLDLNQYTIQVNQTPIYAPQKYIHNTNMIQIQPIDPNTVHSPIIKKYIKHKYTLDIDDIQLNYKIDARDSYGKWVHATIVNIDRDHISNQPIQCTVNFIGWSSKWNESYHIINDRYRLAKYNTYAKQTNKLQRRLHVGDTINVRNTLLNSNEWCATQIESIDGYQIMGTNILFNNGTSRWYHYKLNEIDMQQYKSIHKQHAKPKLQPNQHIDNSSSDDSDNNQLSKKMMQLRHTHTHDNTQLSLHNNIQLNNSGTSNSAGPIWEQPSIDMDHQTDELNDIQLQHAILQSTPKTNRVSLPDCGDYIDVLSNNRWHSCQVTSIDHNTIYCTTLIHSIDINVSIDHVSTHIAPFRTKSVVDTHNSMTQSNMIIQPHEAEQYKSMLKPELHMSTPSSTPSIPHSQSNNIMASPVKLEYNTDEFQHSRSNTPRHSDTTDLHQYKSQLQSNSNSNNNSHRSIKQTNEIADIIKSQLNKRDQQVQVIRSIAFGDNTNNTTQHKQFNDATKSTPSQLYSVDDRQLRVQPIHNYYSIDNPQLSSQRRNTTNVVTGDDIISDTDWVEVDVTDDELVSAQTNALIAATDSYRIMQLTNQPLNDIVIDKNIYNDIQRSLCGINNLGNTCYYNTMLQFILTTPELVNYFIKQYTHWSTVIQQCNDTSIVDTLTYDKNIATTNNNNNYLSMFRSIVRRDIGHEIPMNHATNTINYQPGDITREFYNILCYMYNHNNHTGINPGTLLDYLCMLLNVPSNYNLTQDAHEYLIVLLDSLHIELNTNHNRTRNQSIIDNSDMNSHWSYYTQHNNSIISQLYCYQQQMTITCEQCHTATHSYDAAMQLTLDVPCNNQQLIQSNAAYNLRQTISSTIFGNTTNTNNIMQFNQLLHSYGQINTVDGYYCDKCKSKQTTQTQTRLTRIPELLLIQLKRFNNTGNKIMTDVSLNEYIDILPLCNNKSVERSKYELISIIDHSGIHYTTYSKSMINSANHQYKWCCFNDSSAYMVDWNIVQQRTNTNYLLLYRKI